MERTALKLWYTLKGYGIKRKKEKVLTYKRLVPKIQRYILT